MEPAQCRQLRNEPSGDRPGGLFYPVRAAAFSNVRLSTTASPRQVPGVGADRPARDSRPSQALASDSLRPVAGLRVIGPSRASALGPLLAELQEPAERLRKIVAGLQVYRSAPRRRRTTA
jgi:hypothetical protein